MKGIVSAMGEKSSMAFLISVHQFFSSPNKKFLEPTDFRVEEVASTPKGRARVLYNGLVALFQCLFESPTRY